MVVEKVIRVIRIIRLKIRMIFQEIFYAGLYQKLRFTSLFEDLNSQKEANGMF
jgi:hypothetical protein